MIAPDPIGVDGCADWCGDAIRSQQIGRPILKAPSIMCASTQVLASQ